ncbi:MAG: DegT/DnrJ/EryC1/StrS family aminotransferase, partial [Sphingopyxis sp.]
VFREEVANRNALAAAYGDALGELAIVPAKPAGVTSAWAQYTLRVPQRDAFQKLLGAAGIPTAVYYPLPMHLQPAYAAYGDGEGSLPVSESLSREVISLPMNPYWTQDDLDQIVAAVQSAFADA